MTSSQCEIMTVCLLSVIDDVIIVYTNGTNNQDHVVMTTEQQFFVVSMDACSNAQIILMKVPGVVNTQAYHISIGIANNQKSSIESLVPNPDYQEFDTVNILPCTALRTFWLSWMNNTIRFGAGDILGMDQKFERVYSTMYTINSFSLISGDTKTVKWTYLRDYGTLILVISTDSSLNTITNHITYTTYHIYIYSILCK